MAVIPRESIETRKTVSLLFDQHDWSFVPIFVAGAYTVCLCEFTISCMSEPFSEFPLHVI